MPSLESLRKGLLEAASKAREYHIDKQWDEYNTSRSEVEAILEQLREFYRQDASSFDEKLFSDIRIAKICARIINHAELDPKEIENNRLSIMEAHESFLHVRGIVNRGTRVGLGQRRLAHCYNCTSRLDNATDVECVGCGWIVCGCGACGCGYSA